MMAEPAASQTPLIVSTFPPALCLSQEVDDDQHTHRQVAPAGDRVVDPASGIRRQSRFRGRTEIRHCKDSSLPCKRSGSSETSIRTTPWVAR